MIICKSYQESIVKQSNKLLEQAGRECIYPVRERIARLMGYRNSLIWPWVRWKFITHPDAILVMEHIKRLK